MNATEQKVIVKMLGEIIRQAAFNAISVPKYGGTLFTIQPEKKEGQFCGIFAYKNHVQLSFANGSSLKDPSSVLLGDGKFRRHVNFHSPDEIDEPILLALLKQASQLSI